MILVAASKRRSRRISSSISCWERRCSLNFSALALFQREKRSSVDDGLGVCGCGENIVRGGGGGSLSAISWWLRGS